MTLFVEIIIGIVLFTFLVVPNVLKAPLNWIGDYPPEIRKRCVELGLIEDSKKRFSKKEIVKKGIVCIVMPLILALIMYRINGVNSFIDGFVESFIIWLAITWYDAIVLDCLWFCHSKKVQIPGTEDMPEYKDYLFHIKQSFIGTALGIPVCLIVGLCVTLFSSVS